MSSDPTVAASARQSEGHAASPQGHRLHYKVEGSGDPVLLIGGFTCDTSVFDALTPLLVSRHQVIRLDNYGVGRSARDPSNRYAGLSISGMAADAAAVIDELGVPRVHVLGHSMGGVIAQELYLRRPKQVVSLTLLSSWAKPDVRLAWLIRLFGDTAATLPPAQLVRSLLPWMFTPAAFAAAPDMMASAVQQWTDNPARPSAALLLAQAEAIIAGDTSKRLGEISVPVLVGVAAGDQLTPRHLSKALVGDIVGAQYFETVEGAHAFVLDQAPAIATRVTEFLTAVSKTKGRPADPIARAEQS